MYQPLSLLSVVVDIRKCWIWGYWNQFSICHISFFILSLFVIRWMTVVFECISLIGLEKDEGIELKEISHNVIDGFQLLIV